MRLNKPVKRQGRFAAFSAMAALACAATLLPAAARPDTPAPAKLGACAPAGGLRFLCGVKKPEDLAALPGDHWLIATGMAPGGGLHLVDTRARTWARWFAAPPKAASSVYKDCAAPPAADNFLAHGLSLVPAGQGLFRLYVVNHGGRETIEVFDVNTKVAKPALAWVGCVAMPPETPANSVAGAADGSLLATVLVLPGKSFADAFAGKDTGAVFEWRPGWDGFKHLAGTDLPSNNGIERSADGRTFYVVSSQRATVTAFSLTDPVKALGVAHFTDFTPDNVRWYAPGVLVSAGMTDDEPACGGMMKPVDGKVSLDGCARSLRAALIAVPSMTVTPLARSTRTPDYTGATIAVKSAGALWIGSFASERLAYQPLGRAGPAR